MAETLHLVTFKSEDDEQRIVWAEVYSPNVPDSDQEFMDAVGIRDMAYDFMRRMELGNIDVFHTNEVPEGVCVVESFIARKGDPTFTEGAWVCGIHVPDDETWAKIKKGEINGFSMEALVHKTVVEVEVELPAVITAKTLKSEGHDHEFYVAYSETGVFQGGRTSRAEDGHFHLIRRGTVTEDSNGHTHRFEHVNALAFNEV